MTAPATKPTLPSLSTALGYADIRDHRGNLLFRGAPKSPTRAYDSETLIKFAAMLVRAGNAWPRFVGILKRTEVMVEHSAEAHKVHDQMALNNGACLKCEVHYMVEWAERV